MSAQNVIGKETPQSPLSAAERIIKKFAKKVKKKILEKDFKHTLIKLSDNNFSVNQNEKGNQNANNVSKSSSTEDVSKEVKLAKESTSLISRYCRIYSYKVKHSPFLTSYFYKLPTRVTFYDDKSAPKSSDPMLLPIVVDFTTEKLPECILKAVDFPKGEVSVTWVVQRGFDNQAFHCEHQLFAEKSVIDILKKNGQHQIECTVDLYTPNMNFECEGANLYRINMDFLHNIGMTGTINARKSVKFNAFSDNRSNLSFIGKNDTMIINNFSKNKEGKPITEHFISIVKSNSQKPIITYHWLLPKTEAEFLTEELNLKVKDEDHQTLIEKLIDTVSSLRGSEIKEERECSFLGKPIEYIRYLNDMPSLQPMEQPKTPSREQSPAREPSPMRKQSPSQNSPSNKANSKEGSPVHFSLALGLSAQSVNLAATPSAGKPPLAPLLRKSTVKEDNLPAPISTGKTSPAPTNATKTPSPHMVESPSRPASASFSAPKRSSSPANRPASTSNASPVKSLAPMARPTSTSIPTSGNKQMPTNTANPSSKPVAPDRPAPKRPNAEMPKVVTKAPAKSNGSTTTSQKPSKPTLHDLLNEFEPLITKASPQRKP